MTQQEYDQRMRSYAARIRECLLKGGGHESIPEELLEEAANTIVEYLSTNPINPPAEIPQ